MVTGRIARRALLRVAAAFALAAWASPSVAAEEVIAIEWEDLIPDRGSPLDRTITRLGIVQHGQMSTPDDPNLGAEVTHAFDGRTVRIAGYLIPLDFLGLGATAFLLVPYVGACIHVPPPPRNQIVLVSTETPRSGIRMFDPVYVTGTFVAAATTTQLAEIGYNLTAETIEPYE